MFEDVAFDDLLEGQGWLLLSICFLSYAFDFLLDGSRHPAVETQRVNWRHHKERIIFRGSAFHFLRDHVADM